MASSTELVVGFPRESTTGDRRTLLTPVVASALRDAGFAVVAESGIGSGVFQDDAELALCGVRFVASDEVWAAPLVLRYKCVDPDDVVRLRADQTLAALFHAEGSRVMLSALVSSGVTAYSYEFVEEHGRFPLSVPGGQIAGVQAVLWGAQALQTVPGGRGVLLAGIHGSPLPQVVIIGCGNVGAAAARTAAALGARVTVLARSEESASRYQRAAPDGVRVEINTASTRRAALANANLVIGAVLVSTFDTPPMITEADLHGMRRGAVIVDATCGYGDGYLPTAGPVQQPGDPPRVAHGILHVKLDALPALVPVTATAAYTANAAPYLVRLANVVLRGVADSVIDRGKIAHAGQLVHPVCRHHAQVYGAGV